MSDTENNTGSESESVYVATDIYERQEVNADGGSGSVENDIADLVAAGDLQAFEDYFGDLDPFAFL